MIIFAGLAATFGVLYFMNQPSSNQSGSSDGNKGTEVVTEKTVAEEIEEVKDIMYSIAANVDSGDHFYYYEGEESGLNAELDGSGIYAMVKFAVTFRFTYSEEEVSKLKTIIENAGFTATNASMHVLAAYKKDNIVCSLKADLYNTFMYCANTNWAWLTEEEKTLIKELGEAVKEKRGNDEVGVINVENRAIKNSQIAPYQKITVGMWNAAGLFYRTSESDKWQFFTTTQAGIECSEYNTDDLKKAFAGDQCSAQDENGNWITSTVQP
ncbi:hypothetical protein IKW73_03385, partial [Candidatus Saccharibacteria bacterium]|nr:hypothetical protein [Candidatus Saccharibacteria bacterium]